MSLWKQTNQESFCQGLSLLLFKNITVWRNMNLFSSLSSTGGRIEWRTSVPGAHCGVWNCETFNFFDADIFMCNQWM